MHSIIIQNVTRLATGPNNLKIRKWVRIVLDKKKIKSCEILIRIVNKKEMTALNTRFRHKTYPTNVLSFPSRIPAFFGDNLLGDIVICASVVEEEALIQQKTLISHWAHIIVHGVLHLLGYDHENEKDANVMESLEIAILQELGFSDPYGVEKIHE